MAAKKNLVKGDVFKLKELGEVTIESADAWNVCVKTPAGNRRHMSRTEFEKAATSGA